MGHRLPPRRILNCSCGKGSEPPNQPSWGRVCASTRSPQQRDGWELRSEVAREEAPEERDLQLGPEAPPAAATLPMERHVLTTGAVASEPAAMCWRKPLAQSAGRSGCTPPSTKHPASGRRAEDSTPDLARTSLTVRHSICACMPRYTAPAYEPAFPAALRRCNEMYEIRRVSELRSTHH